MATATKTPSKKKQSLPEQIAELRELVVTYAKQETVEPLKNLGRFVGYGVVGSFLIAMSGVFLTLGSLRLLQGEASETFDGNWTWAPYAIVMVGTGLAAFLAVRAISKSGGD